MAPEYYLKITNVQIVHKEMVLDGVMVIVNGLMILIEISVFREIPLWLTISK